MATKKKRRPRRPSDTKDVRTEDRIIAAIAGRRHYLAKNPCPKCRDYARYTSSGYCVTCTKARASKRVNRIRGALREARE